VSQHPNSFATPACEKVDGSAAVEITRDSIGLGIFTIDDWISSGENWIRESQPPNLTLG
jgi:hypothetical protein